MRTLRLWTPALLLALSIVYATDAPSVSVRGHLRQQQGKPPYLELQDHRHIQLEGDEPTTKVLNDARLKDSDFEVLGHYSAPDRFEVNKIHIPSLFVYRGGKRLQVSYWCDVCYIRTSSPGKCWCCQKYTDLDPIEPEQ